MRTGREPGTGRGGSARSGRPSGVGLALILATLMLPAAAPAQVKTAPERRGFDLFGATSAQFRANRVDCSLTTGGEICYRSGHGLQSVWPAGTVNSYIFNSGMQLAGIIGADGGPWANDTSGAFFFDPKGTTVHGLAVTPLHVSFPAALPWFADPNAPVDWPDEAWVPFDSLYHPTLQGKRTASDGDAWWLMWEGNPALNAGRPHPLGVLVETRVMGWNSGGSGLEDIIFLVFNAYNITSLQAADYASAPTQLQPFLLTQAQQFHALNREAFDVTLPAAGYTITGLHLAIGADADVAQAGVNYASVHLPLGLGFTWDHTFGRSAGWTFDPAIHGPPFFEGAGLTGIKFMRGPAGNSNVRSYSNTINGGAFGDAWNTTQLYRYLSGNISIASGDQACNSGDPTVTRICYINNTSPADMRHFQSAEAADVAPGEAATLVVAYVFAAPLQTTTCNGSAPCDIRPGDPNTIINMHEPTVVANGVNVVDSIAGFLSATDVNGDGQLSQWEFTTAPRSLYGKAQVAQAMFEGRFLVPSAPEAPDFFLVPGDDQVTIMWRESNSEATGDPYFQLAKDANTTSPGGNLLHPNPLYDPNFREFDVEGYRIYRGRVDTPDELELIAQFDYTGSVMADYGGQIFPGSRGNDAFCAPELGITTQCAASFDSIAPGLPRTTHIDYQLTGSIRQIRFGDRTPFPDGSVYVTRVDTLLTGGGAPLPELLDTGVPFVFVDTLVRNSFRYFYSVTAFDVNSWQSGSSSLESVRVLKDVVPVRPATNYENSGDFHTELLGRGVLLDLSAQDATLDSTTGRFSGPAAPTNAGTITLNGFAPELFRGSGAVSVRLDSLQLGAPYEGVPHRYWFTASSGGAPVEVMVPILQPTEVGLRTGRQSLPGLPVDPELAARYGGQGPYALPAQVEIRMEGPDYHSLYGRGCTNGRDGFANAPFPFPSRGCSYNGSRWFDGPSPQANEVMDHPIGANVAVLSGNPMADFNNAGRLTGVTLLHNTQAYLSVGGAEYRPMEGIKSGARRAADFNVYWGGAGAIDSVIDVTHNVEVPFAPDHLGGTWGILNQSVAQPFAGSYDQRSELTSTDFHCLPPINQYNSGSADCGVGTLYQFSRTAIPGPVVPFSTGLAAARTAPPWPDAGFGLYLSGDIFTIALAGGGVPPSGTVWTLRTYIGAISGGVGAAGDFGPYIYNVFPGATNVPRSWTAPGTELRLRYDVVNQIQAAVADDLGAVHTVPDPFYLSSGYEDGQSIRFINLPEQAIIRIYTSTGVLVSLVEHDSSTFGGEAEWDVKNRDGRNVASGVYFYHIEAGDARRVGRMTVVQAGR